MPPNQKICDTGCAAIWRAHSSKIPTPRVHEQSDFGSQFKNGKPQRSMAEEITILSSHAPNLNMDAASVTLAIMPLLISAVEDFGAVQSFFHRVTNYREEAVSLFRELNAEHVRFRCTCETLLQGVVPEEQMRAFVKDPSRDAWESIVTQSSERFQGDVDIMTRPLSDLFLLMVDALEALRKRMNVGSDDEVSRSFPLFLS